MNSNTVKLKPETFGHLHLVYHFTVPLSIYGDNQYIEYMLPPYVLEETINILKIPYYF